MDSETGMRCAGALEQVEVAPVDAVAAEDHKPQIVEPLIVSEGFHHMAKQGGDCTEDRDARLRSACARAAGPRSLGGRTWSDAPTSSALSAMRKPLATVGE